MEHLCLSEEGQQPPEEVFVLQLVEYDGKGFKNFPERCGYNHEELRRTAFPPQWESSGSQQRALSLIQEWLFFGLIQEFARLMDVVISRDYLIRTANDRQLACTAKLPEIFERILLKHSESLLDLNDQKIRERLSSWLMNNEVYKNPASTPHDIARELSPNNQMMLLRNAPPDLKDRARQMNALTVKSRQFLAHCMRFTTPTDVPDEVFNVWLSANLLAEAIFTFNGLTFGVERDLLLVDINPKWISRAVANGFCPSKLVNTMNTVTDVYLATSAVRSHYDDHSTCTVERCKALPPIDDLPRHRPNCTGGETCSMLGPDEQMMKAMKQFLDDGTFPVYTLSEDESGKLQLGVKPGKQSRWEYIAVSHVWSHGLGNPNENAVPICQLRFIRQQIMECYGRFAKPENEACFWLDTLCVPLDKSYRRQAIRQMRNTYEAALVVLVLDSGLLACKGDIALRLKQMLHADWLTRLWTYQEGCLAEMKVSIAFEDAVISLRSLLMFYVWRDEVKEMFLPFTGANSISEQFVLRNIDSPDGFDIDNILQIASSLHRRQTTRIEDEPICIATLVGVDIKDLPDKPSLVDILTSVEGIPQDIIFTPGARCAKMGLRWAPASFLDQPNKDYRRKQNRAELRPAGLVVTKDVVYIDGQFDLNPQKHISDSECFLLTSSENEPLFVIENGKFSTVSQTCSKAQHVSNAVAVLPRAQGEPDPGEVVILTDVYERNGMLYGHWTTHLGAEALEQAESRYGKRPDIEMNARLERNKLICID